MPTVAASSGLSGSARALLPALHVFHGASWGHPIDLLADLGSMGEKGSLVGYLEVFSTSPLCLAEWNFVISKPALCNLYPRTRVNRNQTGPCGGLKQPLGWIS